MPFTPISWPTDSTVTLCRVPWDGNYRDVVRFPSEAARTAYFESLAGDSITLEKATYLKPGEPITVPTPYSRAYTYNYAVVKNPALPVPGEVTPPTLFYFVTGVAYVAPNTTALTVELDVWQTYIMTTRMGRCFLEHGHWPMAQAKGAIYSAPLGYRTIDVRKLQQFCTMAESLDVGNEYLVATQNSHEIYDEDDNHPWLVIFASTTDLSADWGTMSAPSLSLARGGNYNGLPGGITYWGVDGRDAWPLFQALRNAPWVSKGILSVTMYPKKAFDTLPSPTTIGGVTAYNLSSASMSLGYVNLFSEAIHDDIYQALPERYRQLGKFHTFPYSVVEVTAHEGNPLLLKPELCSGAAQWFRMVGCFPAPFTRIGLYPVTYGTAKDIDVNYTRDYRTPANGPAYRPVQYGSGLDNAVWISDFPQFALTNDGYINYMATTKNTRDYQYESAGWAQAKAARSYNNTLTNAYDTLETNERNKQIQNVQDAANMAIGAVGNIASMNYGGAISAVAGGAVNMIGGNMQFQNTQELQRGIATNNALTAEFAARGDYQNAISAINAAVQDAALTAPSVVGQQGGNGFNAANGLMNFEYRLKMPDAAHIRAIGEYWLRYGYAYRAFMQPPQDLQVMTHASYWKMQECYITNANADEGAKNVLRGILEKGVTVYTNPGDIGNLDFADNVPL